MADLFSGTDASKDKYWWEGGSRTATGTVLGNFWNEVSGADAQNAFNQQEAEKDRQWQEYMSSTAYQRAAADMKKAGINPATLSGLSGGSAASTPSGASASASNGPGSGILGTLLSVLVGGLLNKGAKDKPQTRVTYIYHR